MIPLSALSQPSSVLSAALKEAVAPLMFPEGGRVSLSPTRRPLTHHHLLVPVLRRVLAAQRVQRPGPVDQRKSLLQNPCQRVTEENNRVPTLGYVPPAWRKALPR